MSFRNLKAEFEAQSKELQKLDPFKRMYLICLYEIAGNLDTLALSSRAIIELLGKQNEILRGEMFDALKSALAVYERRTERS